MFCVLLPGLIFWGGCSITIGTGGGPSGGRRGPSRPSRYEDVTISEIDAVSQLSFDSGKLEAYRSIASRPKLSASAQVYLVQKSLDDLSFESSKQAVIMALINNPDFLAEGKQAILDNLDVFSFDSDKQSILKALNRRGPVPSARRAQDHVPVETTVEVGIGTES